MQKTVKRKDMWMNQTLTLIISSAIPTILVGILLFHYEHKQSTRYAESEGRAKTRKQEASVTMELQMATAKLSFANAKALQRGHANGEVEEGIRAYEEAKENYYDFINRQAINAIDEIKY